MYEFTSPEPTIKEFKEHFDHVASEATVDGESVNSHQRLRSTVQVVCADRDDDNSYELVGIDVDMLPGCGCWAGAVIVIRRKRDNPSRESLKP
jgi:hypothetical protein